MVMKRARGYCGIIFVVFSQWTKPDQWMWFRVFVEPDSLVVPARSKLQSAVVHAVEAQDSHKVSSHFCQRNLPIWPLMYIPQRPPLKSAEGRKLPMFETGSGTVPSSALSDCGTMRLQT